ncbi:GNAT family N-acetyltransferase [Fictibacillus enclensis]|uniref:GNAT family N-acetyltransferase n=1 Tax=Fictibacillus enclensis TaxID=1017270 RepID=UPI0025A303D7|nr:GNAT family N-acetyltransferase [Fictibacillus enclensis]MDM5336832.1 GNAT family N-acetyltransferase [Fictibacillus enclensis]
MSEFFIRRGTIEDSLSLSYLMGDLGYPTTEEEMRDRLTYILQDPAYTCFVACCDDLVIGMIGVVKEYYFEKSGTCLRIIALVVTEEYQGNGFGKALVGHAENWAEEQGCTAIVLHSGKQRKETHEFYRNLDYDDTGLRFIKVML